MLDDAGLKAILESGAAELGLALGTRQIAQLLTLVSELLDWSARFNLTAIRAPEDIVRKHLLDSLAVLPHLHGQRIADVGSGAGFPGLPLAIADPNRRFTLIEATGKKVRFIEHAVAEMELNNVAVVHARAESFRPPTRFDAAIARALASLADFIRVAGHLCVSDGRWFAMKGQLPSAELSALPRGWRALETRALRVPGLEAARHLVILQRAADSGPRSR